MKVLIKLGEIEISLPTENRDATKIVRRLMDIYEETLPQTQKQKQEQEQAKALALTMLTADEFLWEEKDIVKYKNIEYALSKDGKSIMLYYTNAKSRYFVNTDAIRRMPCPVPTRS